LIFVERLSPINPVYSFIFFLLIGGINPPLLIKD
jgi:hypothetical protein